mgnify:CR=1 FL=1
MLLDLTKFMAGRACKWATFGAATSATGTIATAAAAGYLNVPRMIHGICSGAGSVNLIYGTALAGSIAWATFTVAGGTPFELYNLASPEAGQKELALAINTGDGVGQTWISVMYEVVKVSGAAL